MAFLGIDWGENKVGIAVADKEGLATKPIKVILRAENPDAKLTQIILDLCVQWNVETIVFGLPLGVNGEETEKCKVIKKFALSLTKTTQKLSVDYYPEYYSTQVGTQGLSRKQKQTMGDAHAAAYILQKYLEWKSEGV